MKCLEGEHTANNHVMATGLFGPHAPTDLCTRFANGMHKQCSCFSFAISTRNVEKMNFRIEGWEGGDLSYRPANSQGLPLRVKVFRPSSRSQGTYHFSSRENSNPGTVS